MARTQLLSVVASLVGVVAIACTTGSDDRPPRQLETSSLVSDASAPATGSSCDAGASCDTPPLADGGLTTAFEASVGRMDAGGICGDGVGTGMEECDGQDLRGSVCANFPGGSPTGTLACTPACRLDTSGCISRGGVECGPTCAVGHACLASTECESRSCSGGICKAATCIDNILNGAETELDCGGPDCPKCGVGLGCKIGADCESGVCQLAVCQRANCADSLKNGAETDIDCGGGCPACSSGHVCSVATDCQSGVCTSGSCTGLGAITVAAGAYHSCAIMGDGGVQCWGFNGSGELGNGTTADSHSPTAVSGLQSSVTALAAGLHHTCALTRLGAVLCWGSNVNGQLGTGSKVDSLTPVGVQGLNFGVTAIAAGTSHTCAIASGKVMCWGEGGSGQLGSGAKADASAPVTVAGLSPSVIAVAAGWYHTCAVSSTGGVQCWGANALGQLGRAGPDTLTPVDVAGLASGVSALSAGPAYTCALAGGKVQCWGDNAQGQLGAGAGATSATPSTVQGLEPGIAAIASGWYHVCARTQDGKGCCWGDNTHGQLGNASTTSSKTPVDVTGLGSGVRDVALGTYHSCATLNDGKIQCWGYNAFGQLGTKTAVAESSVPVPVSGF